jgi:hypothetical protein
LLIYCSTGLCHHSAVVDADWPDETVLRDLDRRAVCIKCGMMGADVRPNWSERPQPESLMGAQWGGGPASAALQPSHGRDALAVAARRPTRLRPIPAYGSNGLLLDVTMHDMMVHRILREC